MTLPVNTPSNEVVVHFPPISDICTAGSVYAPCPVRGKLVRAYSVLTGAITTADCTWSMEVNDVAVTGTATVAYNGSGAGTVDSVVLSGAATNVNQGDVLEVVSGGESSGSSVANFYAVIRT